MLEEAKAEPATGPKKDWTTGDVDVLDPKGRIVELLPIWGFIDARAVRKQAGAIGLARRICDRYRARLQEYGAGAGWSIRFSDGMTVGISANWLS